MLPDIAVTIWNLAATAPSANAESGVHAYEVGRFFFGSAATRESYLWYVLAPHLAIYVGAAVKYLLFFRANLNPSRLPWWRMHALGEGFVGGKVFKSFLVFSVTIFLPSFALCRAATLFLAFMPQPIHVAVAGIVGYLVARDLFRAFDRRHGHESTSLFAMLLNKALRNGVKYHVYELKTAYYRGEIIQGKLIELVFGLGRINQLFLQEFDSQDMDSDRPPIAVNTTGTRIKILMQQIGAYQCVRRLEQAAVVEKDPYFAFSALEWRAKRFRTKYSDERIRDLFARRLEDIIDQRKQLISFSETEIATRRDSDDYVTVKVVQDQEFMAEGLRELEERHVGIMAQILILEFRDRWLDDQLLAVGPNDSRGDHDAINVRRAQY